jgi:uncharacterized protein (TIGR03083 family)
VVDIRTFAEAARALTGLVDQIRPDQWEQPGLGEWDLRSLVGHASRSLITVETYLDRPAEREDIPDPVGYVLLVGQVDPASVVERGREAGRGLGDDPAGFVRATVERVLPLVEREDDRVIQTLLGGMRLSSYLPTRAFELVVHGLDIARAAGLAEPPYSEEVLREVLELAAGVAARSNRGPELLLALTGRRQLSAGFSVV